MYEPNAMTVPVGYGIVLRSGSAWSIFPAKVHLGERFIISYRPHLSMSECAAICRDHYQATRERRGGDPDV